MKQTAKLSDADSGVPGGKYTAVDLGNGKWNLLDVPIMSEVPAAALKIDHDISKEWMDGAVEKAGKLKDAGYLAPLHVNHHEEGQPTERAGFVLPKRVAEITHLGKKMWCIFADLLEIPAKVYEAIKNRELPYRSAEFPLKRAPEIKSLALLKDEAPFCKLELLTVGREIKSKPSDVVRAGMAEPAMAMLSDGKGAVALFKFQDGGAEVKKLADAPEKKEEKEENKKHEEHEAGESPKHEEKEHEGEGEAKMGDAEVKDVNPVFMKCLKCLHKNIMAMSEKIGHPVFDMAAFDELGKLADAEEPPVNPKTSSGYKPTDQPAETAHRSNLSDKENAMPDETNVKLAEQAGEIAALKTAFKAREHKDAVAALVDGAEVKLSGWHIDDDVRAEMAKFADADPSGKLLDAFVGRYQKSVPKDPPSKGDLPGTAATIQDPPEVVKLSNLGPEKLELARKISHDYDVAIEHAIPLRMSRERFIELNLKS